MSTYYADVPGYEGLYQVTSGGHVISLPRSVVGRNGQTYRVEGRTLSPGADRQGYLQVHLSHRGCGKTFRVHVLVALAFIGDRPVNAEVRHLDGDHLNNSVQNLAYGTASENRLDSVLHGTHPQAKRTHCQRGHLIDGRTSKGRYCKSCRRAAVRRYKRRKREAATNPQDLP